MKEHKSGSARRPHVIRRLFSPNVAVEVDDEIRFHIDQRTRDLTASGMPEGIARQKAEDEFGDRTGIRDEMVSIDVERERAINRREYFANWRQDVRHSARSLRRSPLFTTMAIACIALGVSVATTIFAAINAILIRPLPFGQPEQLAMVYAQMKARNINGANISWPDFESWRDRNTSFAGMGIWTWTTLTLTGGDGEAERVEAARVSANVFPLLAVRPMLGRSFVPSEEIDGNNNVIVLSYDLWKRRYGSDSSILNRTIMVDGQPNVVIGVMPPQFNFPERGQAWIPFAVNPAQEAHGNRGYAAAVARLKPGVSMEAAQADLLRISQTLETEFPDENRGWNAQLVDMRSDVTGDLKQPLLVFLAAVGFVLLIACANVANLMLARAAARQQETAVRMALGAGRGRIVRAVLTESLLLSLVGGTIGLVLARNGLQLLTQAFPNGTPYFFSLRIDFMVVLFAVAITTVTTLLFALLPALGAAQLDLQTKLRDNSRAGGSRSRGRAREQLVIAEVALSAMLLIAALLLIRSNRALLATDFGFDKSNVITAQFTLPAGRYPTDESNWQFVERLLTQIKATPGVISAGTARGIPFSGWSVQGEMSVEGKPGRRAGDDLVVHFQGVSPDYFKTLQTPLLQGRMLSPTDRDTAQQVAVINETLAKLEFPDVDPVGRRMKSGNADRKNQPWVTIVGVVKDIRQYQLPQRMGPAIYYPQPMFPTLTQTLVVRTSGDPLAFVPVLRRVMKSLDADVPLYRVQSLDQVVDRSLWRQQLQSRVLVIFAGMALLLAAVGMYGMIAWSVTQRTREVGIRIALGSTGVRAAQLIFASSMRLTVIGIVIGTAGALGLSRFLATLLYQVSPFDAVTFLTVPFVLVAVAVLASWLPARRAARISPTIAMRAE